MYARVEYVAQLSKSFTVIILAARDGQEARDVVLKTKDGWSSKTQKRIDEVLLHHSTYTSSSADPGAVGAAGPVSGLMLSAAGVPEALANGGVVLHPTTLSLWGEAGSDEGGKVVDVEDVPAGTTEWTWNAEAAEAASEATGAVAPPLNAGAATSARSGVVKVISEEGKVALPSPAALEARLSAAETESEHILAELGDLFKRGRVLQARSAAAVAMLDGSGGAGQSKQNRVTAKKYDCGRRWNWSSTLKRTLGSLTGVALPTLSLCRPS